MYTSKRMGWCGAVLVAAALVGCTDGATAPAAPDAMRGSLTLAAGQVGTTVFTVPREGGKFSLAGGHVIKFEADAICDPVFSGYGPKMWNVSCSPSRLPITITATSWTDADGRARVDFSPDLRFVPTSSAPSKVLLQLRDKAAADANAAIFYCPNVGECFDESATDASMASKRDSRGVWVYRYIKHFSGYNVSTGRSMTTDEAVIE